MPNNPTIDTALDMYMSWHIVDSGVDYQQLSESLDTEISSGSSKFYLLRETKELAESFDEGPKSDVFIMLENHSEESITVKQAIEKKWFVIEYSNDKKKYTYGESSMYINLGCSNVAESDLDVMNNYLMKYYGTPNFFGISMNFDYDTIEDFISNEKDRSAYDLGWIGDEYGVFVTIRYDGRSTYDGTETLNIDNIMIVPVEMLEYTQKFSTTPYLPDSTVYNSNLIK